jgi:hypothetical protein
VIGLSAAQTIDRQHLHDLTLVHYGDSSAHMGYDSKIMAHHEHGQPFATG